MLQNTILVFIKIVKHPLNRLQAEDFCIWAIWIFFTGKCDIYEFKEKIKEKKRSIRLLKNHPAIFFKSILKQPSAIHLLFDVDEIKTRRFMVTHSPSMVGNSTVKTAFIEQRFPLWNSISRITPKIISLLYGSNALAYSICVNINAIAYQKWLAVVIVQL